MITLERTNVGLAPWLLLTTDRDLMERLVVRSQHVVVLMLCVTRLVVGCRAS